MFFFLFILIFVLVQEAMDTSESMKSETPQPSAKDQNTQKEQIDNNITGKFFLQLFRMTIICIN